MANEEEIEMIRLLVQDEFAEEEYILGYFNETDITNLIDFAAHNNLKCLKFIDVSMNTYFSEMQMFQIKKEVAVLVEYSEINPHLISLIIRGIDIALSEGASFLKFEPLLAL